MRNIEKLRSDIEYKIHQATLKSMLDEGKIDPSVVTRKDLGFERQETIYDGADAFDIQKSLDRVSFEPLEREKEVREYINKFQLLVSRLKLWMYKKHVMKNPERFNIPSWLVPHMQAYMNLINPGGSVVVLDNTYEIAKALEPKSYTLAEGVGTATRFVPLGNNKIWHIRAPKTRIVLKHFQMWDEAAKSTTDMVYLDNSADIISLSSFEQIQMYYPYCGFHTHEGPSDISKSILSCSFRTVYANDTVDEGFVFFSNFDCRFIDMLVTQKTGGAREAFRFENCDDSGSMMSHLTALGKGGTTGSGFTFNNAANMYGVNMISDTMREGLHLATLADNICLAAVEVRSSSDEGVYANHSEGRVTICGLNTQDNQMYGVKNVGIGGFLTILGGISSGNLAGHVDGLRPGDIVYLNDRYYTPIICDKVIQGCTLGKGDAFLIGDDVYLVDINEDGAFSIQGKMNRSLAKIFFGDALDTSIFRVDTETLQINKHLIAYGLIRGAGSGVVGDAFQIGNDAFLVDINEDGAFSIQGRIDRAKGKIWFGNLLDCNIRRVGPAILKTDGEFQVGGDIRGDHAIVSVGDINAGGYFVPDVGYKSTDGTSGLSSVFLLKDSAGNEIAYFEFKNGLLTYKELFY